MLAVATSVSASTSEVPAAGFDSIKKWAAGVEGEPSGTDGDVEMADASVAPPGDEATTEAPETLHERTTGGAQGAGAGDVVAEGA